ncbi:MAG: MFS transporter, partial [Actinomycetes bacterium]
MSPPAEVSWRRLALPAYGPTLLVSVGYGAVLPLVALSARGLGATVGQAALVVALVGLGQLVGDLPAGALAARIGEKRALTAACLVDAAALLAAFAAPNLLALAVAVFVTGLAGAVFSLARQAYLTEAIPVPLRARALSTLGGTLRLGMFVGPFAAAMIVSRADLAWAYVFAAATSLAAAGLTALLPDLPDHPHRSEGEHRSVASVLAQHRRVLLTLGTGVRVISAARASRQSLVPLWAEASGLDAASTSLIFGLSAGVDLLLFYPGGAIMDRY